MAQANDLKGRKCLFVSYFYPPAAGTALPGAMRSVKFIRNLANAEIFVLSVQPDRYGKSVQLDQKAELPVKQETIYRAGICDVFGFLLSLRSRAKRVFNRDSSSCVNHSLVTGPNARGDVNSNPSIVQRFKDFVYNLCYFPDQASPWIPMALYQGWKIIRRHKLEVIFATGMPWSALVVGYLLSLMTGRPLVADFRDPWVNNPFHLSKGKFLDWWGRWLERHIVLRASVVSLNTAPLREEFLVRYPNVAAEKMVVLPNGYDESDFSWLKDAVQVRKASEELVLGHAGFLYGLRDPAPLLDALLICRQRLAGSGQKIRFVQIGRIDIGYDLAEKYAALLEDGLLELRDEMSYHDCLRLLAASDVLVNVQPGTRTQVPSKLYDYLGLNRPILNLTPHDGALGCIVEQFGFGDLFEPEQVEEIADRLLALLQQKDQGMLRADYPLRSQFEVKAITEQLAAHLVAAEMKSG